MNVHRELFRLSDDPDGQLLLALVLCLGTRTAIHWDTLWDYLDARRRDGDLHASIDHDWATEDQLWRALGRLSRRLLIRKTPGYDGSRTTYSVRPKGYEYLASRLLLEPSEHERRNRAA